MILIAESGATKTDWKSLDAEINLTTAGIHPLMLEKALVIKDLKEQFSVLEIQRIEHIYFYGTGCGSTERSEVVKNLLSKVFTHSTISVYSDMEAATKILFPNKEGIACILGTGANSVWSDGVRVKQKAPSLGYILGDEGSGAYLGKQIIAKFLRSEFEPHLQVILREAIALSSAEIIDNIYHQPYPNRFLASFAPLAKSYIHFKDMEQLCQNNFKAFFQRYIFIYKEYQKLPVSFVGGLGFAFQDVIKKVAQSSGVYVERFVEKPIEELIQYYQV